MPNHSATLSAHTVVMDPLSEPRFDSTRRALNAGLRNLYRRSVGWADSRDLATGATLPGAAAQAYAMVKLLMVAAGAPVAGPIVALVAARNTARVRHLIRTYPNLISDLCEDRAPTSSVGRVKRVPAGNRYVITSDLHRGPRGLGDLAGSQGAPAVYERMLEHYSAGGWSLIENGDIEDYWLVSGSTYGATYDVMRMLAGAAAGVAGRSALDQVYEGHLERTVGAHRRTYDLIRDNFQSEGRYLRTVGNHDSVYNHPGPCGSLAGVLGGTEVVDWVVLEDTDGIGVGVVTHGHQTDSWNAPSADGLGRLSTSLGCSLYDLPLLRLRPGIPDETETERILGGRSRSVLASVNQVVGANLKLYSVDESRLFDSFKSSPTPPGGDPYLILGHTHVPLADPLHPSGSGSWPRYLNCGSGAFKGLVTAVEWDGTSNPANPTVRLVGWARTDDRRGSVERVELGREAGSETLTAIQGRSLQ